MQATDTQARIQAAMRAVFPAAEARVADFYAMQEYHLGWRDAALQPASFDPGKLVRPRLVLLACAASGGSSQQALSLAAGIQLIHDFSLIHDDIEDNSDTRRGRTTVWTQWGLAQGINTGDGMFVLAHLAVHRLRQADLPADMVLEVLHRFDETILTICEGQFLDLRFEGDLTISEDDYLAMIGRKTAALIAAACGLGALVGGANPTATEALFAFGRHLGLAFQIEDDILGIWGAPEATGKPPAADIARRKLSLPVIYGLRHAQDRAALAALYQQDAQHPPDSAQVLAILADCGAQEYTAALADQHHAAALASLDNLRPQDDQARAAVAQLRQIAEGLRGRQT